MRYGQIIMNFDGACDNNSKLRLLGMGVLIRFSDNEHPTELFRGGSNGTSNKAEYYALIDGLQHLKKVLKDPELIHKYDILVKGDSQLVIRQVTGEYRVKNPELYSLWRKVRNLINEIEQSKGCASISFEWIPREQNKEADRLSKMGVQCNYKSLE